MDNAVLMMAYGGPSSLDDIEPYLLDVMGGRAPSATTIADVREHYARIGGRSPLLDITRAQASALQDALNANATTSCWRVFVGMRHWRPYIKDAVAEIAQSGIRNVIALCMTPHYSPLSVGAYFARLHEAQAALHADLAVTQVNNWHTQPLLIEAIAAGITAARDRFPTATRQQVVVLFTGHSLPATPGDPYASQLSETAELVASLLGLEAESWRLCYQSTGRRSGAWLGPSVEDVIVQLAGTGRKHLIVAPIGFVADHVETLYDIDIECHDLAAAHGAHLERSASLNTSPTFISALANIVQQSTKKD